MALAQRRITCRPPLTRRHRTGSTRRACLPPAQERRTESHGEQRFPQPNHPRNVYVPATESRPEAGTDDELRAFVHPAPSRRCPELRRKPLLYQRRQPDYDDSCRRTPPQHQLGRNRELGSGREHSALADEKFAGAVPEELVRWLREHPEELSEELSQGYILPSALPVPRTSCFGTCVPATACARMPRSLCAARTSWHNATKSWLAIPCRKPHSWEESISISNPI